MNETKQLYEMYKLMWLKEAPADKEAGPADPDADPAAGADDAGGNAGADDMGGEEQPGGEQPSKALTVKFDISSVKNYNVGKKFMNNFGTVLNIDPAGLTVQCDNNAVIFVNFADLLKESYRRVNRMLTENYKFVKSEALDYIANTWNEYGPEGLADLDQETIQKINATDPILAADLVTFKQKITPIQAFIETYTDKFLNATNTTSEMKLSKLINRKNLREAAKENEFGFKDKDAKVTTEKETETRVIKKAFNIHDVEIVPGKDEDYENSTSSPGEDMAVGKMCVNALYNEQDQVWPVKVNVLTNDMCMDTYDNPYYNDVVKIEMSNGDKLTVTAQRGASAYNPTIRIHKTQIKKGSTVIYDTNDTDKWLNVIYKAYKASEDKK